MRIVNYLMISLLVTGCLCSNKQTNKTDNNEQEEIVVEDNSIMTPGVTYVTTSSRTSTDEFGGKVFLDMEFIIYQDGTASGNLIETNARGSYGNSNSYNHPVEGTWREVSKHDKRFLEIKLIVEGDVYYNWFYYYIDENLNAYADDINTVPLKLRAKVEESAVNTTANDKSGMPASNEVEMKDPCPKGAVDLGLSVYWAERNLNEADGFTSSREDPGYPYAWGEIEKKYSFHGSNYKASLSKYNDSKTVLDVEDDVAHVKLGGGWRIPTDEEWEELKTNCSMSWYDSRHDRSWGDVEIYQCVKSKINGNSIILPATGYVAGEVLCEKRDAGYYWSSTRDSIYPKFAKCVRVHGFIELEYKERYRGLFIRPVHSKSEQ